MTNWNLHMENVDINTYILALVLYYVDSTEIKFGLLV